MCWTDSKDKPMEASRCEDGGQMPRCFAESAPGWENVRDALNMGAEHGRMCSPTQAAGVRVEGGRLVTRQAGGEASGVRAQSVCRLSGMTETGPRRSGDQAKGLCSMELPTAHPRTEGAHDRVFPRASAKRSHCCLTPTEKTQGNQVPSARGGVSSPHLSPTGGSGGLGRLSVWDRGRPRPSHPQPALSRDPSWDCAQGGTRALSGDTSSTHVPLPCFPL